MAIPKNKRLVESSEFASSIPAFVHESKNSVTGKITIRPVRCYNNYIAVLQSQTESTIQLVGTDGQYKSEGLVIGVGPGLADGNGGRLVPSVRIGDYVMIGHKNHIAVLTPDNGPYKGQKVVIVNETNIICALPNDIEWTVDERDGHIDVAFG